MTPCEGWPHKLASTRVSETRFASLFVVPNTSKILATIVVSCSEDTVVSGMFFGLRQKQCESCGF